MGENKAFVSYGGWPLIVLPQLWNDTSNASLYQASFINNVA